MNTAGARRVRERTMKEHAMHAMNDKTEPDFTRGTYPYLRERTATHEARLGHARVGDRVRILAGGHSSQVGLVGRVTSVDDEDETFTFAVEADGDVHWCYDVERVEDPTTPPSKTTTVPTELDAYKALVRRVALRIAAEQEWCDEGLAAAMSELGINVTNTYRVTTRFYGHQDVTVDVEAFDEDRARDAAFEDAREARNEAEWTYRDDDESEVRSFRLMS